jgi:rhodanese-related sulfurtransferase
LGLPAPAEKFKFCFQEVSDVVATISAEQLCSLIRDGRSIDIIDVRTPAEFGELHIEGARNCPLDGLDPRRIASERNGAADKLLYIVCRSGARGSQACQKFISAGFDNVVNVEGGTLACAAAGAPVVRGKKAIPLHCQVQIITGTLVVTGALLVALHPYWAALPAVMGAGLLYSGLTNTCAMGSLLSRMPWNKACPTAVR